MDTAQKSGIRTKPKVIRVDKLQAVRKPSIKKLRGKK